MKYAVIKTGGRQYRVSEGDVLAVEKLGQEKGGKIEFDDVLLTVDEKNVSVGQPLVRGAMVEGEVLEHFQGPKVKVARFKAKSRYRRVKGHRQDLTRVRIKKIGETEKGKKSGQKKEKEAKT